MRIITHVLSFLTLASIATQPLYGAGGAEEVDPVEVKLREALRDSTLKLRDAQGQIAAAQAAQIAAETKIKELTVKTESLGKELLSERNVSANMISELTTKLEERGALITGLQASIEKWRKSYAGATALAAKKEGERAKLASRVILLERLVTDQQVKNVEMYKVGLDTLDRYERFGLGDALLAREPFIGTTRVKFETAIQDQNDKLTDARIGVPPQPGASPAPSPAASPSTETAPAAPAPTTKPQQTPQKTKAGAKAAPFATDGADTDAKPAKPTKPQA